MKKTITALFFLSFVTIVNAQQASDYFPSQTGFEWKFKATPLDSGNIPNTSAVFYRMDYFESVANYNGKLAAIVQTKTGPLQTIQLQPFLDSLFYNMDGTNGFEYLSIKTIEPFLIALDSLGIDSTFNFLEFFTSLQDWYSNYRFASPINSEYLLQQQDATISGIPIRFKYVGNRLQDQAIQTVLGSFNCKKFLIQWKVYAYNVIEVLTTSDTIWIAPGNWIVQDIIPANSVDLSLLGIPTFTIPGLDTKLTDEIVTSVQNEEQNPIAFSLEQNYPNPFNPSTTIRYAIPSVIASGAKQSQLVTLKVYDVLGNEVATLVNEEKPAGSYEVNFNSHSDEGQNLSSGIYFYKLQAGSLVETKKMILLR
jgi:hypothetical protein